MQNQALKRKAGVDYQTGVTARIPLLPPPIPRSIPEYLFSDREIREIGGRLTLDDQIAALRFDDDELTAEIAKVRRDGENTAREIGSHLEEHERQAATNRIHHSYIYGARHHINVLEKTGAQHESWLVEHDNDLAEQAQLLEDIRIDIDTLAATNVDRTELEALQARVDQIEVWGAANNTGYGNLAREVMDLKLQLIRLQRSKAPETEPQDTETKPIRWPLHVFYGACATAIGIALTYALMPR
jgi:hypothetical protein